MTRHLSARLISSWIVLAVLCIAANAWAFDRNLSGVWTAPSGRQWVVVQVGTSATFQTSTRTEQTGLLTFLYSGYISDGGSADDFTYAGMMEPKEIRFGKKRCRMTGNMNASGDVAGEVGGRVIHMQSCQLDLTIKCPDIDPVVKTFDCTGTWT